MNKVTNMIGSFIVAIAIITFPVIVGIGIASDWLERESVDGALIHPGLTVLWIACVGCTLIEVSALGYALSDSE